MKARWFDLLALAAGALLAAPSTAQESTVDSLRRWGLLGWWSLRCDLPVSSTNYYYGYVIDANGRAYHERDLGDPARNDKSEILWAVRHPEHGTLEVVINFASISQARKVVFMKADGRIRATFNRGPNDDITVNDGIFRHNDQPTPWQSKCR